MQENRYFPKSENPIINKIPDTIPDGNKQVFTPNYIHKDLAKQVLTPKYHPDVCPSPQPNDDQDWYDEPDYTQAIAQGVQEVLSDARPQLTRSEAEEQMHLTELRRLAEAYSENDAKVISEVMSKNYPMIMFAALQVEFTDMKYRLDTITGAVNNDTQ